MNKNFSELIEFYHHKLHCTSKFCGKSKTEYHVVQYVKNQNVIDSLGHVFRVKVIGFSISKNSIAADVAFEDIQSFQKLWNNDLEEERFKDIVASKFYADMSYRDAKELQKKLGHGGHRAHFTLGLANGQLPVQSGIDLVNIKLRKAYLRDSVQEINVEGSDLIASIFYMGETYSYVKLKSFLEFESIFAAEY